MVTTQEEVKSDEGRLPSEDPFIHTVCTEL